MDAYQVLGLTPGATEEQIKAAYRALAQKYDVSNYEAGPLQEEAMAKMNEINAAFDELMGKLRTGEDSSSLGESAGHTNETAGAHQKYGHIRQMINHGAVDEALKQLINMPQGATDAEWNFLVGSAYYYKGWVSDALRYFQAACRIEPNNREYQAALNNLQNNAKGAMPGNPYGQASPYGTQAVGCSCCDMCTAMICMDMCCGCGRGGC